MGDAGKGAGAPKVAQRILILHWAWTVVGGAERKLFDLKATLEREGHVVEVFACAHPDNLPCTYDRHFPPYRDKGRVRFGREGLSGAVELLYNRPARRGLAAVLDEYEPDLALVNTWQHHLSHSVLLELRKRGIPIVQSLSDFKAVCPSASMLRDGEYCAECFVGHYFKAAKYRCMKHSLPASILVALEGYLHRFAGAYDIPGLFFAPSEYAVDALIRGGMPKARVRYLHNQVNLEFWQEPAEGPAPGRPYVVVSGRLYDHKGIDTAIDAMVHVRDVDLVVAGAGPEEAALKRRVEELALDNVRFTGHLALPELRDVIVGSHALLMPSKWGETFGNSTVEAFACSRPVVGSDMGYTPYLVEDGVSGRIFPVGDSVALSVAIKDVCSDTERAVEMGRVGRSLVESRFSPKVYYPSVVSVLEETLRLNADSKS